MLDYIRKFEKSLDITLIVLLGGSNPVFNCLAFMDSL